MKRASLVILAVLGVFIVGCSNGEDPNIAKQPDAKLQTGGATPATTPGGGGAGAPVNADTPAKVGG